MTQTNRCACLCICESLNDYGSWGCRKCMKAIEGGDYHHGDKRYSGPASEEA